MFKTFSKITKSAIEAIYSGVYPNIIMEIIGSSF